MRIIFSLVLVTISLSFVVGSRNATGQVAAASKNTASDPLASRLDVADAEYRQAVKDAAADAKSAIAKRLDDAAKKGDLDRVRLLQAALTALENDLPIPPEPELKAVITSFDRSMQKARSVWDGTYKQVEREYTKAKNFDVAESVRTRSSKGPTNVAAAKSLPVNAPTRQRGDQSVPASPAFPPVTPPAVSGIEFIGFRPWSLEAGFHPGLPNDSQLATEWDGRKGRINGTTMQRPAGESVRLGGVASGWLGKAALFKTFPRHMPLKIRTQYSPEGTSRLVTYDVRVFPVTPSTLDHRLGQQQAKKLDDYPAVFAKLTTMEQTRVLLVISSEPRPDGQVCIRMFRNTDRLDGELIVGANDEIGISVAVGMRSPSSSCDVSFEFE